MGQIECTNMIHLFHIYNVHLLQDHLVYIYIYIHLPILLHASHRKYHETVTKLKKDFYMYLITQFQS